LKWIDWLFLMHQMREDSVQNSNLLFRAGPAGIDINFKDIGPD
jgi:hypothetical protein